MPRLTTLRIGALEDLALQLRFAPRSATLRHIRSAEAISADLDPQRAYPLAWLVFSLTGYRAEEGDESHDTVIVGEALRADLSAFVERLSDQAALTAEDLDDAHISLEELCRRWKVDRKTVERRRREGLIARRVRGPDGRARLVFAAAAVERFEQARKRFAPPLKRLDSAEKAKLIRRARAYRERLGWTLNQAAERLAERTGRSRETVRRALRAHDAGVDAPIFGRRAPLTDRDRLAAHRARLRGLEIAHIAWGMGWTVSTAQRAINEGRALRLEALDLDAANSPVFQRDDVRDVLLAPPEVREGLGAPVSHDASVFVATARAAPRPVETVERLRAAAACYLRWSVRRRIESLPPASPRAADLDAIETDLRWCSLLLVELVRAQQGLALRSIEDLLGAPLLELPADDVRRLHALAMGALIDAAWTFDPFRPAPHRLAGHAAGGLSRALARPVAEARGRMGAGARRSQQRDIDLWDWTRRVAPWQRWLEPPVSLRSAFDRREAPGVNVQLVALRFGWTPKGRPPMTCEQIGPVLHIGAAGAAQGEFSSIRAAAGRSRTVIHPDRRAFRAARRGSVR